MTMPSRLPIGQILLQRGYIDVWQLQSALAHQQQWGGRLGAALVRLGFISESSLLSEVARQLGVAYLRIGDRRIPDAVVRLVPERLVRARRIFPVILVQGRPNLLVVVTSEPQNLLALDEVSFASGKRVQGALAGDADLDRAIERHLGPWRGGLESAVAAPDPSARAIRAGDTRRAPRAA